jgi:hypothetical protein
LFGLQRSAFWKLGWPSRSADSSGEARAASTDDPEQQSDPYLSQTVRMMSDRRTDAGAQGSSDAL